MSVHIHCRRAEPETSDEISIGQMYEYGESVPQDYATALHWYQLAAETSDTAAEAGVQRIEQLLEDRAVPPGGRSTLSKN